MNTKTPISFTDLKQKIDSFKINIATFSEENADEFENKIKDIKEDAQFILLESEERYGKRLGGRSELNKSIKEKNDEGPRKTNIDYIQKNPEEFYERLTNKVGHFKDGDMYIKKLKRGNKVPDLIPVKYEPEQMVMNSNEYAAKYKDDTEYDNTKNKQNREYRNDHFDYVRKQLKGKEDITIEELTQLLDDAKERTKNIFESYKNPEELFNKLGIKIQEVDYSFFAKENKPMVKEPGKRGLNTGIQTLEKEPKELLKFKKIGHLMKYVIDNNIPYRANNIIKDNDQWYQFYFYDKDITILISDVAVNNKFRDATYVTKGIIPGLRNVNKEELKGYQGKKIVFNDSRCRRVEEVFNDETANRPIIGEEKEGQEGICKSLITDRAKFIGIIKEYFTEETFDSIKYKAFVKKYNADLKNEFLLRDTIIGNASLLGLGGNVGMKDIKKAIFQGEKKKLEKSRNSYFFDVSIKQTLIQMSQYSEFSPKEHLGSSNYMAWIMKLLKMAFNEKDTKIINTIRESERKAKLQEMTGIENMVLSPRGLTSLLGGSIKCADADYHQLLRERFMLNINGKSTLDEYKELQKKIVKYETTWEDGALRPNDKKTEKKGKVEKVYTPKVVPPTLSPKIKKVQNTVNDDIIDVLKNPITFDDFPMNKVKNARIVEETERYRIVKMYNCSAELRLYKTNKNGIHIGDKLEVFGDEKNFKHQYIRVMREIKPGYHKERKFLKTHTKPIEEFVRGETYPAVVNNIIGGYIWVSINDKYSGRIHMSRISDAKVGDTIKVIFDGKHQNIPNRVNLSY